MSTPIKILIVEDNVLIAYNMQCMLEEMEYTIVANTTNYESAIEALATNKIDLALLDIQLNTSKTGIDIGKHLKDNYNIPFIFVTSNSDKETIDQAKKVNPDGYLLKPYDEKDLYAAIEIAITNYQKKRKENTTNKHINTTFIFVKEGFLFKKISFEDILYVKADNVYVDVYTKNKTFVVRSTLKSFLERLPSNRFYRINKSYVINIDKVEAFNSRDIVINEQLLPLSKEYKTIIKNKLMH